MLMVFLEKLIFSTTVEFLGERQREAKRDEGGEARKGEARQGDSKRGKAR